MPERSVHSPNLKRCLYIDQPWASYTLLLTLNFHCLVKGSSSGGGRLSSQGGLKYGGAKRLCRGCEAADQYSTRSAENFPMRGFPCQEAIS